MIKVHWEKPQQLALSSRARLGEKVMIAELVRQRHHGDFREPAAANVFSFWRKLAVMLAVIYPHDEGGHGTGHGLAKRDLGGDRFGGNVFNRCGLSHEGQGSDT